MRAHAHFRVVFKTLKHTTGRHGPHEGPAEQGRQEADPEGEEPVQTASLDQPPPGPAGPGPPSAFSKGGTPVLQTRLLQPAVPPVQPPGVPPLPEGAPPRHRAPGPGPGVRGALRWRFSSGTEPRLQTLRTQILFQQRPGPALLYRQEAEPRAPRGAQRQRAGTEPRRGGASFGGETDRDARPGHPEEEEADR